MRQQTHLPHPRWSMSYKHTPERTVSLHHSSTACAGSSTGATTPPASPSATPAAWEVVSGRAERGIVICGSGVGASVAANKVPGIRACLCHDVYSAHQGVEHDELNVLCLGARVVGIELAKDLVSAFLNARSTGEERHRRRLNKVAAIEKNALQSQAGPTGGGAK